MPPQELMLQVSGFSAVGSAHVWGARGRWFESSNPDKRSETAGFHSSFMLGISDEVAVGGNKKVRFFCHKIRSYAYYS